MSINNTAAIAIMEAGVASPSRTATSAGIWRRPALASERFSIRVTTANAAFSGLPPPVAFEAQREGQTIEAAARRLS